MSGKNRLRLGDLRGSLLPVVGLSLLLFGCGSQERLDFRLTIVVADPLGESETDSFPLDIVDLSLPIYSSSIRLAICSGCLRVAVNVCC